MVGLNRLNKYFQRELELLLTPIKLDPAHPFPYLPSGSLNLAVTLEDPREQSGDPQFASNGAQSFKCTLNKINNHME